MPTVISVILGKTGYLNLVAFKRPRRDLSIGTNWKLVN